MEEFCFFNHKSKVDVDPYAVGEDDPQPIEGNYLANWTGRCSVAAKHEEPGESEVDYTPDTPESESQEDEAPAILATETTLAHPEEGAAESSASHAPVLSEETPAPAPEHVPQAEPESARRYSSTRLDHSTPRTAPFRDCLEHHRSDQKLCDDYVDSNPPTPT
ncbi:hypothetical protein B484DRAFT_409431, partial [Ochromonadaceae sp. CCMP2298]